MFLAAFLAAPQRNVAGTVLLQLIFLRRRENRCFSQRRSEMLLVQSYCN
jgi:hypothetical protein